MRFSMAWTTFSVGDYVQVSDGSPMPTRVGGLPWRFWRSHNFTGRLVEKIDGESGQRAMRFELAPHANAKISYAVHEATDHDFTEASQAAFFKDVFVLI